ncbi:MAG: DUF2934 domain-containing protein [Geminicoccaceae bacterium]
MSTMKPSGGKSGDPGEPGLDKVDAASAGSMDASDPPAFGGVTGAGAPESKVDRQERIRRRAHELWQEAGSPVGSELDFWLKAEAEVDGEKEAA